MGLAVRNNNQTLKFSIYKHTLATPMRQLPMHLWFSILNYYATLKLLVQVFLD